MSIPGRTAQLCDSVSRVRAQGVNSVLAGSLMLCVCLLLFPVSGTAKESTPAVQNQIRAALEKWTKDFNARNSSQVCSLFAPDLISNYQGQPEGNYDSLCARLKKSLNDPAKVYHYDLHIDEILVAGDLAVVRLQWTLQVRPENPSQEKTSPENASTDSTTEDLGLDVFRRQPDGTWKIARFMAYPASTP